MQTKEERDAATKAEAATIDLGPLMGVPAPKADSAVPSSDPTQISVLTPEGKVIDWASRKGFGEQQQKLAYPKREGYQRYWFNDEPARLEMARAAGWTPVLSAEGKPESRIADKGTGMRTYLHEIPEAWYKADLAEGQKRADAIEESMRKGNAPNPGGQAAGVSPQKGFYGGVKISKPPGMR